MASYADRTTQSVNYGADTKNRIINVDSRYREDAHVDPAQRLANPTSTTLHTNTNFLYRLPTPIRNVIRMRLTSVEIPNTAYAVSKRKRNSNFIIQFTDTLEKILVEIPDGNYGYSTDVTDAVGKAIVAATASTIPAITVLEVSETYTTGRFTIKMNRPFTLIFKSLEDNIGWPNRAMDFGLGYNMGFRFATATSVPDGSDYSVTGNATSNFTGDNYLFLQVNDEHCVEHITADNSTVRALAKIIINIVPNTIAFNDSPALLTNEIHFRSPKDINIMKVALVDPYGIPVDTNDIPFSFSVEFTEVVNSYLFDSRRKHLLWNPANLGPQGQA